MKDNEFGCKVWAESCIELKNGDKCYVDNSVDNIEKQMKSGEQFIEIELSMIVNKGKKHMLEKSKIETVTANN